MKVKRFLSLLMGLVLAGILLLSACAPAPSSSADPLTVVQLYYEALHARDIEKAMTYAADDIIVSDSGGYYYGKEELAAAIQRGWDAGDLVEASDFKVDGSRVTSCWKYFKNGTQLDHGCNGVTHVRNGRIIFDGIEPLESLFVVQEFYDALNAGNVDEAMSWVAVDALFANPTGRYEGQAAIRASLETLVKDGITFELSKYHMVGARVSYEYKVLDDGQQIDSGTNGLTIVKGGWVVFDGTQETAP